MQTWTLKQARAREYMVVVGIAIYVRSKSESGVGFGAAVEVGGLLEMRIVKRRDGCQEVTTRHLHNRSLMGLPVGGLPGRSLWVACAAGGVLRRRGWGKQPAHPLTS